jgi:hypothetical protein
MLQDLAKILIQDNPEENISAFAFNIGRVLEHIVTTRTNNLETTNKELEARILDFRKNLVGDALVTYDTHFKIQKD